MYVLCKNHFACIFLYLLFFTIFFFPTFMPLRPKTQFRTFLNPLNHVRSYISLSWKTILFTYFVLRGISTLKYKWPPGSCIHPRMSEVVKNYREQNLTFSINSGRRCPLCVRVAKIDFFWLRSIQANSIRSPSLSLVVILFILNFILSYFYTIIFVFLCPFLLRLR